MLLPRLAVRDARSGQYVLHAERVTYEDDSWWYWLEARVKNGVPQLWVKSNFFPNGFWQTCVPWYGGLVWIFPS